MSMPHLTVGSWRSNSITKCLDAIASKTGAAEGSPDIFAEKTFPERVVRGPSELIVSSTTESVLRVTPLLPLGKTAPANLRRPSSGGNLSDALTATTSRMNGGILKGRSSSSGAHNNSSANRKAAREACRMSTPSAEANPGLWASILSGVECTGGSAHGVYRAQSDDVEDDTSAWTALDEAPSGLASELSFSGDGGLPEDLPECSFEASLEPDNHQQAALDDILSFAPFDDAGLRSTILRCRESPKAIEFDDIDSFYEARVGSKLFEDSGFVDVNKQDPGAVDAADDACREVEDQIYDPFEDLTIEDIDALLAADEHLLSAEASTAACGIRHKDGHLRDTSMGVVPLPTPSTSRAHKRRTAEPLNATDCHMFVKWQRDCSLLGKVNPTDGGASLEICGMHVPSGGSVTDGRRGAVREYPMPLKLIDPPLKRDPQSQLQGSPSQGVPGRETTEQLLQDAGRALAGAVPVMDLCRRVRVSTVRKQPTPQRTTAGAASVAKPHYPSRHSLRSTAKPDLFLETVLPTQPMGEIFPDWAGMRPQGESKINTEGYYDIAEPSQHLSSHLPARATTTKPSRAEAPASRWRPIVATQPMECPQDAVRSSHETLEATQDMGQLVTIQDNILAENSRGMNFEDPSISSTPPPPTSPSEYPGVKKQRMLIAGGESSEALNALPPTQPMNPHSMPFWSLPPTQPMVGGTLGHQSIPINRRTRCSAAVVGEPRKKVTRRVHRHKW
ncbi:hypothetical protein FOZ63_018229 [Perkinsus olseni]|uniref:Uncharacterized protein n=1 Tax=Perkinsus olseni TaxID=32597 RepID=A0A7J6SDK7_PEROL|nr:hypothetical protein FOZ63_018229 [Perkinsus olseni]